MLTRPDRPKSGKIVTRPAGPSDPWTTLHYISHPLWNWKPVEPSASRMCSVMHTILLQHSRFELVSDFRWCLVVQLINSLCIVVTFLLYKGCLLAWRGIETTETISNAGARCRICRRCLGAAAERSIVVARF